MLHTAVLLDEVLKFLNPRPGGRFIDATFGAGGHTRAILERTAPDGMVLAFDRDASAVERAKADFGSYGARLRVVKSDFREIASLVDHADFRDVDGVLADVGLSSMMIDDPQRGFSFMHEGPLDMRMDREAVVTAADVVNTYGEKEIANILFQYGEERRSRAIARSIVRSRPLHTTRDLSRAVERVLGGPRHSRIHPATRTFQGLRIFVNDELRSLELFLDAAMSVIRPGGRLVVISFHSLEDRIVKNKFRGFLGAGTVLTKKVVTAGDEEVRRNPRARSARLRAWERA
jgi:16S rRNA (cytosine1402-N4)-methyltransferase